MLAAAGISAAKCAGARAYSSCSDKFQRRCMRLHFPKRAEAWICVHGAADARRTWWCGAERRRRRRRRRRRKHDWSAGVVRRPLTRAGQHIGRNRSWWKPSLTSLRRRPCLLVHEDAFSCPLLLRRRPARRLRRDAWSSLKSPVSSALPLRGPIVGPRPALAITLDTIIWPSPKPSPKKSSR